MHLYARWWGGRAGRSTLGGVCGLLLFVSACDSLPQTVAGVSLAEYDLQQGKQIWSDNCMRCHGVGLAGAPKIGDTAAWATPSD